MASKPDLHEALCAALANTFAFYFKAHSFHWNVRGPTFAQLHELFGDIYADANEAADGLAERIRTLDKLAPASPYELFKDCTITFTAAPDAAGMIDQLHAANDQVCEALETANDAAEAADNEGLGNFLQERLDKHAKWGWMLRASGAKASRAAAKPREAA